MRFAQKVGADLVVAEAGIGGLSDELSRCSPIGAGFTEIFDEHLGVLAPDVAGIARDNLGVRQLPSVRFGVSLPQGPVVDAVRRELHATHPIRIVTPVVPIRDKQQTYRSTFNRRNVTLGLAAVADLRAGSEPLAGPGPTVDLTESTLNLVGRGQAVHAAGVEFWIESAASASGVHESLSVAERSGRPFDIVLCCIPDDRDVEAVRSVLVGQKVLWCAAKSPNYTTARSSGKPLEAALPKLEVGQRVLVTGIVAFISEFLLLVVPGTPTDWW